jgi:hypothetical protein
VDHRVPIPRDADGPRQALVVLFALDAGEDAEIRDRAVVAAGLSFTISDPRLPDNPLVFVNPAFERTTGYSRRGAGPELPVPAGPRHRPRGGAGRP